jgi:hypothetical protein
MSISNLSIAVVWSDSDLLEIRLAVAFGGWAGAERVYVTRDDLTGFAAALDAVAEGADGARLSVGQPDLSYATVDVFEYGGARRLGMHVVAGHAVDPASYRPDRGGELRVSLPIERGALPAFAAALREITLAEQGIADLFVPSDWHL